MFKIQNEIIAKGKFMNNKEIRKIISEYKPHKGFFDLSSKPKELSNAEYAKILKTQNFLASQNTSENIKYLKKFNPIQYNFLRKISTELQGIILNYWGDSVFV